MFGTITRIYMAVLIWLIAGWLEPASAGQIVADILQIKHDRLYFGVGTESLILENSPFHILYNGDTIYSDYIEISDMGVSFSRKTDQLLDTLDIRLLSALIKPAEIVLPGGIDLYCDRFRPGLLLGAYVASPLVSSTIDFCLEYPTDSGNGVCVTHKRTPGDLWNPDGSLKPDGLFTFGPANKIPDRSREESLTAPFFAALIPNLGRPVNHNGLFTTSLYYRFNDKHLSQIFRTGSSNPFTSLYDIDPPDQRLYPFKIRQGEQLLKRIANRPEQITIAITDIALESVGKYLADILSRDRISVTFTKGWDIEADLYLTFVPLLKTDPFYSLQDIYEHLKFADPASHDLRSDLPEDVVDEFRELYDRAGPNYRLHSETMKQIDNKLKRYAAINDLELRRKLTRQIDRLMKEDLGVFPLFCPQLHFIPTPELRAVEFDNDHLPVYKKMIRVHLPTGPSEERR